MLSRILWVGVAGAALVAGMVLQDGPKLWTWAAETGVTTSTQRGIEARVDRAIDRSIDNIDVVRIDGREINVTAEQKRAMADAISGLVKAETSLALMKAAGGGEEEIQAATKERDRLKTQVEQLEAEMKQQGEASRADRQAMRDAIREEVRETVRDAVRD